jgi:hypothetical protein
MDGTDGERPINDQNKSVDEMQRQLTSMAQEIALEGWSGLHGKRREQARIRGASARAAR